MSKTYLNSLVIILSAGLLVLSAPAAAAPKKKAVTASAPVVAPASGIESIGKGDTEFGVFANYTTFDDVDSDSFLIGASVGKFLSDSLALRVTPIFIFTDGGGSSSYTFSPFVSVEKLFRGAGNRNPVVPFVGGGIGITLGYTDSPGTSYSSTIGIFVAPTGGVKYFLSERASVEYALSYQIGTVYISTELDSFSGDIQTLQQNVRFNFYY